MPRAARRTSSRRYARLRVRPRRLAQVHLAGTGSRTGCCTGSATDKRTRYDTRRAGKRANTRASHGTCSSMRLPVIVISQSG
jgi:hypothetical protein